MSLVESSAAFFQRCDEISPDGALKAALDAQEIKTHSAMAFTMGTQMTRPMNSSTGWHKECLERLQMSARYQASGAFTLKALRL